MTALLHALAHLARLRWLGAAFCALAIMSVTTHVEASTHASSRTRVSTTASATKPVRPKTRVGDFEQSVSLASGNFRLQVLECPKEIRLRLGESCRLLLLSQSGDDKGTSIPYITTFDIPPAMSPPLSGSQLSNKTPLGEFMNGAGSYGIDVGIGLPHMAAQNGLLGDELQTHAERLNTILGVGLTARLYLAPADTPEKVWEAIKENKSYVGARLAFGAASTYAISRLGGGKLGMGLSAAAMYGGLLRPAMEANSVIHIAEGALGVRWK